MHARTAAPLFRPVKAVLLVVGLLAALLAAAFSGAGSAHAATPDRWGYAFLDNPTPPTGYVPDPSRQWGSWTSPGSNPVTVDQVGLGAYEVHFPMIGGAGGIAHTTAVNGNGDWCQLNNWQQSGAEEDVYVNCYTANGVPDNSMFTVVYTTSSGVLPAGAPGYGYIYSDIPGTLLATYNSSGAANSVSKAGVGVWKVWLPNLGQATPAGNLQVTAVDTAVGAHCKVTNWSPAATGQNLVVSCYKVGNSPYDTRWTLSYAVQRALHGAAFPPKSFGYLWFNGSVPALTNFNSAGGSNGLSFSGPTALVTMPNIANPPDDAQVTAYGPDPSYCGLTVPWDRSGGIAAIRVSCFNSGRPIQTPFFVAYTGAF